MFESIRKQIKETLVKNEPKAYLVYGPIGVGKTTVVKSILEELKINGIWFDIDDLNENTDVISKDLFSKKKVIIIDNANDMSKSLITLVNKLIQITKWPILIICNDSYPLKPLKISGEFKFIRPNRSTIQQLIKNTYGVIIDVPEECDIRNLMINVRINKDKTYKTIFDACKMFYDNDLPIHERINAFYYDSFLVPLFIRDNYIQNTKNLNSICEMSNTLSECDTLTYEQTNLKAHLLLKVPSYINKTVHTFNFPNMKTISNTRCDYDKMDYLEQIMASYIDRTSDKKRKKIDYEAVYLLLKDYDKDKPEPLYGKKIKGLAAFTKYKNKM